MAHSLEAMAIFGWSHGLGVWGNTSRMELCDGAKLLTQLLLGNSEVEGPGPYNLFQDTPLTPGT